jgi:iron complex transport system ATP-binding protein
MTSSDSLLIVRDVSLRRAEIPVLHTVSLSLRSGERLALVGPNGAGKTTLLKCLNRILTGWSGSITLEGKDLTAYGHRELARWMAYVPQAGVQAPPFSVEAFVSMGRYPYQGLLARPNKQDRRAVDEALDLTDTTFLRDRPLYALSGGERQRVILAAALAQEAKLLLLDEPTVFLDPRHEAAFCAVLMRVHEERNLTMITATHDLNRAVLMHEHVVALKQGRVLFSGEPVEFMTRTVLQNVYDNPFLLISHPDAGHPMVLPEVPA